MFPARGREGGAKDPVKILGRLQRLLLDPHMCWTNAQVADFLFPHHRSEHSGGLMCLENTQESYVCRAIQLVTWKLLQ